MSDIDRIHALRDAGHITPDEAERLIGVLVALDGPTEGAGAADAASAAPEKAAAAGGAAAGPRDRAHGAAHTGGTTRADPTPIDLAPAGTRWCTIELTASDLTVIADDVAEPQIEADDSQEIVQTPTDDGLRVTARRRSSGERWMGRSHAPKTAIRLPRGWGVELDMKAGKARVRDVPFVRGRMVAGDLEVQGAEAVDVSKSAGDLTVAFRPTRGRHRITAKAGDVAVRLLPGSDAMVELSVSMGALDVPGGFDVQRRMIGAKASGRLGAGTAQVEVRLAAGDLTVRGPTEAV